MFLVDFRGSNSLKDWINDVDGDPTLMQSACGEACSDIAKRKNLKSAGM